MFRAIVVGTDGSGTAAAAVLHAVEIAKRTGAELVVLSAYPPPRDAPPPFGAPGETPVGVDVARGLLEDVERRYGGEAKLRTISREGPASDVILEIAEEEEADVIVVGNKGMTGARRFVLGSVPNAVSHHAPCHVLIVHTTGGDDTAPAPAGYRRVLIATDGSPTAQHAVRIGDRLARALGAEIAVLHVGDDARGTEILRAVSDEYGDVRTLSVPGDPADKILETAESQGTDLIVVGNKGMTGAKRFLLGSVPNQVSHHAPCNVLIVKTT